MSKTCQVISDQMSDDHNGEEMRSSVDPAELFGCNPYGNMAAIEAMAGTGGGSTGISSAGESAHPNLSSMGTTTAEDGQRTPFLQSAAAIAQACGIGALHEASKKPSLFGAATGCLGNVLTSATADAVEVEHSTNPLLRKAEDLAVECLVGAAYGMIIGPEGSPLGCAENMLLSESGNLLTAATPGMASIPGMIGDGLNSAKDAGLQLVGEGERALYNAVAGQNLLFGSP